MSAALHLTPWTDERLALDDESEGKKFGQLAGSYISDLAALRKAIILCPTCLPKFASAKNGYVTETRMPHCMGKCDGCRDMGMERRIFVHHQQIPR